MAPLGRTKGTHPRGPLPPGIVEKPPEAVLGLNTAKPSFWDRSAALPVAGVCGARTSGHRHRPKGFKLLGRLTDDFKVGTDDQRESQAWTGVTLTGDMASNKPGESAEEMARLIRSEEPVRLTLARLFGGKTDERAWRMGAKGEREVSRRLRKLSSSWMTLHDLPLGRNGANLDHLVVGPGGVFALNTKNLRGKVWVAERALLVNGHKTDYLWKSKAEAERVGGILSKATGNTVVVKPVLVVMGAELNVKAQPHGVTVVTRKRIRSWLEGRPGQLTDAEVNTITDVARRAETWISGPRLGAASENASTASPSTGTVPAKPAPSPSAVAKPNPPAEALRVVPWRRYGKDRLYVNGSDGAALGYLDRDTGETHVHSEADRAKVVEALRAR